eukprot:CAMPEP_0194779712 /NCGR_PEP_ID=MMETSP0323_2-20130528/71752_1 /TAXON_ID=2866 ORGANISM="Crypthecodinium cohnii, Strain Seligo" /NCGR_SAMPLE_ID=MMETSP0323_2 /ASSEMBLY_ACC=CAM_ASM_000346 /LENGTH=40 /DNA_ID= /DNA_START= /DNA_END= /DNA_ORIENTATION=
MTAEPLIARATPQENAVPAACISPVCWSQGSPERKPRTMK